MPFLIAAAGLAFAFFALSHAKSAISGTELYKKDLTDIALTGHKSRDDLQLDAGTLLRDGQKKEYDNLVQLIQTGAGSSNVPWQTRMAAAVATKDRQVMATLAQMLAVAGQAAAAAQMQKLATAA